MPSSVFPMGTTIYNPEKCWNGYTVFQTNMMGGENSAAVVIDMNGNIVNMWKGLDGNPNRILPGGSIIGSSGVRDPELGQMELDLVQVDWDGNIVWAYKNANQHHDYQREGNPVGYYVPGMEFVDKGRTLILSHEEVKNSAISEHLLMDDKIVEIDWKGHIIWEWLCTDHFDELGFDDAAKKIIAGNPNLHLQGDKEIGDWNHMNSISWLGSNKWYDMGDERFHPENIIWDGRQTNIIAITSRKTDKIVWKVGPDYTQNPELRKLGQIVGQHHAHMIPRGLPGEGNILVYDNGGWAGFGPPNPGAPKGVDNALRDYSRVLEFDPTTLEIVWQYTPEEAGFMIPMFAFMFYSGFISSAQRLPNGNTLITEGSYGRLFEVTPGHEIVWEFVNPYKGWSEEMRKAESDEMTWFNPKLLNMVYRAYRLPYEWIPQVDKPEEKAVIQLDNTIFRVPGSVDREPLKMTDFIGTYQGEGKFVPGEQYCVVPKKIRDEWAGKED